MTLHIILHESGFILEDWRGKLRKGTESWSLIQKLSCWTREPTTDFLSALQLSSCKLLIHIREKAKPCRGHLEKSELGRRRETCCSRTPGAQEARRPGGQEPGAE